LSDVNRGLDGTSKLQFVGLDWNDLDQWHLSHKLLRILVVKAIVFSGPFGALDVSTLDVGSLVESLRDILFVHDLGNTGVHY